MLTGAPVGNEPKCLGEGLSSGHEFAKAALKMAQGLGIQPLAGLTLLWRRHAALPPFSSGCRLLCQLGRLRPISSLMIMFTIQQRKALADVTGARVQPETRYGQPRQLSN